MNFNRIKKNYDTHLWTKAMVWTSYNNGIISIVQYYAIVKTLSFDELPQEIKDKIPPDASQEEKDKAVLEYRLYLQKLCEELGIWQ